MHKSGESIVVVGGLFRQPSHFIDLDKVLEKPEMDPCNYNKAIQDKDVTLWQKAMKIEMESMYSKIKSISCETTWWGKTHRLQVDLQEQEKDRWKGENLSGIASGEGVTPRKKGF